MSGQALKYFFFKKRAILDQGLALHFSYRIFFLLFRYPSVCSIVIDFLREKNATLFISAMGKILLISNWIYRQMSKLISNHETYTKLIFCERLMCGTIYTFAQKLNDKREKLPKRDIHMHSSEIRGLCLMKWPSKTLQNLPYFIYMKTQSCFSRFSFLATYFIFSLMNALH